MREEISLFQSSRFPGLRRNLISRPSRFPKLHAARNAGGWAIAHFKYPFAFSQSATIFCTSDETGLESSFAAFSSATFTAGINRTLSGGYAWLGFAVGIFITNSNLALDLSSHTEYFFV
jgi:hypothetical protein